MIQDNEVFVIDDFIEKDYQEKIKEKLLGKADQQTFPWFYIEDVTAAYDPDSKHRPGLAHPYVCLLYTSPSPRDRG